MIIFVNSRRVPAFKLQIHADDKKIYEGLFHSQINSRIVLEDITPSRLDFKWSFFLSKEEKSTLLNSRECPSWGLVSYDSTIQDSYSDPIDLETSCSLLEAGIFSTRIENIQDEMNELHLIFRRTKLIEDFALLDVRFPEEEAGLDISFVNDYYNINVKDIKRSRNDLLFSWIKRSLIIGLFVLLFSLIPMVRLYYLPTICVTIVICILQLFFIIRQHKDFRNRVKLIEGFKENKSKIIIMR